MHAVDMQPTADAAKSLAALCKQFGLLADEVGLVFAEVGNRIQRVVTKARADVVIEDPPDWDPPAVDQRRVRTKPHVAAFVGYRVDCGKRLPGRRGTRR